MRLQLPPVAAGPLLPHLRAGGVAPVEQRPDRRVAGCQLIRVTAVGLKAPEYKAFSNFNDLAGSWLGRWIPNLGMSVPKTKCTPPLGDAPARVRTQFDGGRSQTTGPIQLEQPTDHRYKAPPRAAYRGR
jgi:hypothetical protein